MPFVSGVMSDKPGDASSKGENIGHDVIAPVHCLFLFNLNMLIPMTDCPSGDNRDIPDQNLSSPTEHANKIEDGRSKVAMCGYVLFIYSCGCFGPFECDSSCHLIEEQIHRIDKPESWTFDALSEIPFSFPESCNPGWNNTRIIRRHEFCSPQWFLNCPSIANYSLPSVVIET